MRRHWTRAHASLESRGARLPALSPPLPPRRKIIVRTRAPDDKLFIAFMTGALFRTVRSFLYHSRIVRSPEKRRNRADLIELFKTTKGLSSTPWSHFFQKGRRHFNQRADLEIGEEASSLRFTFVLLFSEGHHQWME